MEDRRFGAHCLTLPAEARPASARSPLRSFRNRSASETYQARTGRRLAVLGETREALLQDDARTVRFHSLLSRQVGAACNDSELLQRSEP